MIGSIMCEYDYDVTCLRIQFGWKRNILWNWAVGNAFGGSSRRRIAGWDILFRCAMLQLQYK